MMVTRREGAKLMMVTRREGAKLMTVTFLAGLDSVTYFPVLSVTVGILVQLIVRCGGTR